MYAFSLVAEKYDAVIRVMDGELKQLKQWYVNLPETKSDMEQFERMVNAYGMASNEKTDKLKIIDPKSIKQVMEAQQELVKCLRKKPEEQVFIMYLFASHGGEFEGRQVIVINEFDKNNKFYKLYHSEKVIRLMAKNYSHSYHLCFYACCRENISRTTHTGGLQGPLSEAKSAVEQMKNAQPPANNNASELEDIKK